ncbi:hypothetical protein [uncultured Piscinibacter sp.]|uniref:hypothetical protein n=1 Tax=uncultured Piscinibacter sp. TaxID=1131835 RepID=UPI002607461F|nr:hypothetical protein [uncultured Piscinibacter sp.]
MDHVGITVATEAPESELGRQEEHRKVVCERHADEHPDADQGRTADDDTHQRLAETLSTDVVADDDREFAFIGPRPVADASRVG